MRLVTLGLACTVLVAAAVAGGTAALAAEPPCEALPPRDPAAAAPCPPFVTVRGWVSATVYATPGNDSGTRTGHVFDDDAEGARVQQAYLAIERSVADGRGPKLGGKIAILAGTDARWVHARGLLDDQEEEYQVDLLEAYLSARLPLAQGLTLRAGKWATPMGFEVTEAANNLLPTRSFAFNYAMPFTHTGAHAALDVSSTVSVMYGLMLGWDVWDDNNSALTHHVGLTVKVPDDKGSVGLQACIGPEQADDDDDIRTVVDLVWTNTWSPLWKTALEAHVGVDENAAPAGDDATWWGVAAYLTRTVSSCLSGTLRAEFFRDVDGARLGEPADLVGLTLGADWTPFARIRGLHVRPEARWDHATDGPFFDAGADEDQFSLTLEALFVF